MFLCNLLSKQTVLAALSLALLASCVHKYETPIAKNTQQPDKVLFDQAMHDIEHGRYEVARISLQTLMNTYESSEYLAKAKLAIADSWYREGGANGMAQAEAEYKDFILFYPGMEEAAEAQNRVCDIHYKQISSTSSSRWPTTSPPRPRACPGPSPTCRPGSPGSRRRAPADRLPAGQARCARLRGRVGPGTSVGSGIGFCTVAIELPSLRRPRS